MSYAPLIFHFQLRRPKACWPWVFFVCFGIILGGQVKVEAEITKNQLKEVRILWRDMSAEMEVEHSASMIKRSMDSQEIPKNADLTSKDRLKSEEKQQINVLWIRDQEWLIKAEQGLSGMRQSAVKKSLVDGDTGMNVAQVIIFILQNDEEWILAVNPQGNFRWVNIVAPLPEVESIRMIIRIIPDLRHDGATKVSSETLIKE